MTDDPYHSPMPVVNAITGFFIALTLVTLPLLAVTSERVKSPYKNTPTESLNSGTSEEVDRRKEANIRRLTPVT